MFQGIALSFTLNICILTEFFNEWNYWFGFEYLLQGLVYGFLSFLIIILSSKIFMVGKINRNRIQTGFSYNKLMSIFKEDYIPILKPTLFIYIIVSIEFYIKRLIDF
jgi:hypothetical protein